jgi:hypothetical protein
MLKPKVDRLHDLRSVLLNFEILYQLLDSGYSFEERELAETLHQMTRSLNLLREEIKILEQE